VKPELLSQPDFVVFIVRRRFSKLLGGVEDRRAAAAIRARFDEAWSRRWVA
jgi:hypothetical protein